MNKSLEIKLEKIKNKITNPKILLLQMLKMQIWQWVLLHQAPREITKVKS